MEPSIKLRFFFMSTLYYGRLSTGEQEVSCQYTQFLLHSKKHYNGDGFSIPYCCDYFTEVCKGRTPFKERDSFQYFHFLEKGSTLIVSRLDRLARSSSVGLDILEDLNHRGLKLLILDLPEWPHLSKEDQFVLAAFIFKLNEILEVDKR